MKISPNYHLLFCSDLHLSHDKEFVWKSRGFNSVVAHDEFVLESLRMAANSNTILVNLGDSCLTRNQTENFERLVSLPFYQQIFLWGNHNAGAKNVYEDVIESREVKIYPRKYKNLFFYGDYLEITYRGQFICLMHYPILSWNHKSNSSWMLCGHEHGGISDLNPDEDSLGKILDAGVDNAIRYSKKPYFEFEEIKAILDKKETKQSGHH